ncbi:MAG: hypothetical protein OHK0035_11660 [Cyanobacteria bacterium J069]
MSAASAANRHCPFLDLGRSPAFGDPPQTDSEVPPSEERQKRSFYTKLSVAWVGELGWVSLKGGRSRQINVG